MENILQSYLKRVLRASLSMVSVEIREFLLEFLIAQLFSDIDVILLANLCTTHKIDTIADLFNQQVSYIHNVYNEIKRGPLYHCCKIEWSKENPSVKYTSFSMTERAELILRVLHNYQLHESIDYTHLQHMFKFMYDPLVDFKGALTKLFQSQNLQKYVPDIVKTRCLKQDLLMLDYVATKPFSSFQEYFQAAKSKITNSNNCTCL